MNIVLASQNFKNRYGFTTHPNSVKFENWATTKVFSLTTLFPTVRKSEIHYIDLSTKSTFIGGIEEFNDLDLFQNKLDELQKKVPAKIIAGGYLEKKESYTLQIFIEENKDSRKEKYTSDSIFGYQKTPLRNVFEYTINNFGKDI
jgi:hypothetical protein